MTNEIMYQITKPNPPRGAYSGWVYDDFKDLVQSCTYCNEILTECGDCPCMCAGSLAWETAQAEQQENNQSGVTPELQIKKQDTKK